MHADASVSCSARHKHLEKYRKIQPVSTAAISQKLYSPWPPYNEARCSNRAAGCRLCYRGADMATMVGPRFGLALGGFCERALSFTKKGIYPHTRQKRDVLF